MVLYHGGSVSVPPTKSCFRIIASFFLRLILQNWCFLCSCGWMHRNAFNNNKMFIAERGWLLYWAKTEQTATILHDLLQISFRFRFRGNWVTLILDLNMNQICLGWNKIQQIKIMVYWVVYHSFTFRILKTTCVI